MDKNIKEALELLETLLPETWDDDYKTYEIEMNGKELTCLWQAIKLSRNAQSETEDEETD